MAADGATDGAAQRSTAAMALAVKLHFGVDRYDEWVQGAQPGTRKLYGSGVTVAAACAPDVAQRMRELSDHGLVQLFAPRVPRADGGRMHPFDFLAIRTAKPVPVGFPALPALPKTSAEVVTDRNRARQTSAQAQREWQARQPAERGDDNGRRSRNQGR